MDATIIIYVVLILAAAVYAIFLLVFPIIIYNQLRAIIQLLEGMKCK